MRNNWHYITFLLAAITQLEVVFASGGINTHTSAILFPWFCQIVGLLVYFFLSRWCHWFPYTAAMFLVGVCMGCSLDVEDTSENNLFETSVNQWLNMDGDLVLLIFLPGLLFLDAYNVNFHLFTQSLFQIAILAFPGVLAGTYLTGLIAKNFLGWNFNLALTFGSILSATDPVAVSALLNECGAPPRLKMHVSGESLLNDGAAIVFFSIYKSLYLFEIDEGGENIDIANGFKTFFKMSLGGVALGISFGLGLILLLGILHRRLEAEENIVQVAATLTVAYISFYTSEACLHMSGVITVVTCGITLRAFGEGVINDHHLMQNFWSLVEHLLNTLIFILAGTLWGHSMKISKEEDDFAENIKNILVLYLAVLAIRFLLIFALYPIISRIGLGSNLKEALFLSWGGLRGAVGIALAINLRDIVAQGDSDTNEHIKDARSLLIIVGGITFITLVVNGPTSAPLLNKLGLGRPSNSRNKIVTVVEESLRRKVIDDFVYLLTFPVFARVDFTVVKKHVPMLADMAVAELKSSVTSNKDNVPELKYRRPNLLGILPYLLMHSEDEEKIEDPAFQNWIDEERTSRNEKITQSRLTRQSGRGPGLRLSMISKVPSQMDLQEHRLIFIELLRSAYHAQIDKGHLDPRNAEFSVYLLFTSLEYAAEDVRNNEKLDDWERMRRIKRSYDFSSMKMSCFGKFSKKNPLRFFEKSPQSFMKYARIQLDIISILSFIDAHLFAQEKFTDLFLDCENEIKVSQQVTLTESKTCVKKAQEKLSSFKRKDISTCVNHYFCGILLNKAARYVSRLLETGILSEKEARNSIEHIQELLTYNRTCREDYEDEVESNTPEFFSSE